MQNFHRAPPTPVYRDWKIYYDPDGPVTGKYRALRFGVSMGANTLEMLKSMIDRKLSEVKH